MSSSTVQELLGHASVETTQIYTHVMRQPGLGGRSPFDSLRAGPLDGAVRWGALAKSTEPPFLSFCTKGSIHACVRDGTPDAVDASLRSG